MTSFVVEEEGRSEEGVREGTDYPRPGKRNDDAIASFWVGLVNQGLQAKKTYVEEAEETLGLLVHDHDSFFDIARGFVSFEGGAAVSIPKSAQVLASLGPQLYTRHAKRVVQCRSEDGVFSALGKALVAYGNYAMREAKFDREARASVNDAILRGRGFLKTCWDAVRKVFTSRYVSSLDVSIDPLAASIDEASWVAVRAMLPPWRVEEISARRGVRVDADDLEIGEAGDGMLDDGEDDRAFRDDGEETEDGLVEVWTIYSAVGIGTRLRDFPVPAARDAYKFVRLVVTRTGRLLYRGRWDVQIYTDGEWPLTPVDLVELPDQLWPQALLGQVRSLQGALDLLGSMALTSEKHRARFLAVVDERVGAKAKQQIQTGSMAELLEFERKTGDSVAGMFQVLNLGSSSPLLQALYHMFEDAMDATTGVTPAVSGAAEGGAVERTATAVRVRSGASSARLSDMRSRCEDWQADVARKEAIAARVELDAEDVERYVNARDIGYYMLAVPVSGGGYVPVRDRRTTEERESGATAPITLEAIAPEVANYWPTFEQATQAAVALAIRIVQAAQSGTDPLLVETAGPALAKAVESDLQAGWAGQGVPPGVQEWVKEVTVRDVWRDTDGASPEEISREFAWEIAVGSNQKTDPAKEVALAETLAQQVVPIATSLGDVDGVNRMLNFVFEANDVPIERRVQLRPPQPQQPTQQPTQQPAQRNGTQP